MMSRSKSLRVRQRVRLITNSRRGHRRFPLQEFILGIVEHLGRQGLCAYPSGHGGDVAHPDTVLWGDRMVYATPRLARAIG